MFKKVLMVLRRSETIVVLFIVLTIVTTALIAMQAIKARAARDARNAQQTDIEVRAFVGNHAESKLGGIQFAVSNRWGYYRVMFQVRGFHKGLNLNNVVCRAYDNGKYIEEDFFRQNSDWNTWLGRFQEVLAEATVGEKNTDMLDPNTISVE